MLSEIIKTQMFSNNDKCLIKKTLGLDDSAFEMLCGEFELKRKLSLVSKHPIVFYTILSLLTNIIYSLCGVCRRLIYDKEDFIFVSCPDTVFRTKSIGIIAQPLNYCLVFLPNFHLRSAIKYYKYFKNTHQRAVFPTILLKDVLLARKRNKAIFANLEVVLSKTDYVRWKYLIVTHSVYNSMSDRFLHSIQASERCKWLLEHQKFYFMPIVASLRKKGIHSTMLQHGCFFEPVFDFIPLYCDNVLCCSEREKTLYLNNGVQENRIKVLGAPLQTIDSQINTENPVHKYNLLVLLTYIDDNNEELIVEVLSYVKSKYNNVLVRMRPRSRKEDMKKLKIALGGMMISKPGTPILTDILESHKVLSFSIDANFEVAKYRKPFVFVWTGQSDNQLKDFHCATKEDYKDEIQKLMGKDFYSTFSEEQYKEVLGETNVEVISNRFVTFIKSVN